MPSIKSILTDIQTLPLNQVEELLSYLEEFIVLGSQVGQVCEEVKEFRFSKGKVCPHCTSESISRNGKYNGKQRYICKDCRKTFTDFTNSATYRSKKSLDKWLKYAKCMIMGLSIRKSAKIVGINIATSFFWRHKILDCISSFLGTGHVDGVIEADEVFFAESFKGTRTANMPRKSRKRGKEIKKRGISKEQICVATALDRQGNLIIEPLCKGRMTHKELERLCLDRATIHYKEMIAIKYAELVYDGMWFSPLREALAAFVDETQKTVTGTVRLKLYKGNIMSAGTKSPYSLYSKEYVTFGADEVYNQADATGFITLFGLPLTVRALMKQGKLK